MSGTIFVAGVHAVGKSSVCSQAAKTLNVVHYSASSIIRAEKASAISDNDKTVKDVNGNQDLLVLGLEKVRETHKKLIILDGHFTLRTKRGRIESIPLEVFRSLVLDGVVVYHDDPEAIAIRMKERDDDSLSPMVIKQHQDAEIEHARLVASDLRIPINILKAFDSEGLVTSIAHCMRLTEYEE